MDLLQPPLPQVVVSISPISMPRSVRMTSLVPQPTFCGEVGGELADFLEVAVADDDGFGRRSLGEFVLERHEIQGDGHGFLCSRMCAMGRDGFPTNERDERRWRRQVQTTNAKRKWKRRRADGQEPVRAPACDR